jgi:hypothetical protein
MEESALLLEDEGMLSGRIKKVTVTPLTDIGTSS